MKEDEFREVVKQHLEKIKEKNPSYSLRSLAQRAKVSPGNLSLFLNNKRRLSPEAFEKLVTLLIRDSEERKDYLFHFNRQLLQALKDTSSVKMYRELSPEEFAPLKEWYFLAFLALSRTVGFQSDVYWISKRLGIDLETVELVIQTCLTLKLIELDGDLLKRTSESVRMPDNSDAEKLNEDMLYHHLQLLQQSSSAVKELASNERDFTAMVFPSNPAKLSKAREIVRQFQDDIMRLMQDGDETEVFRLCVQLYPIT